MEQTMGKETPTRFQLTQTELVLRDGGLIEGWENIVTRENENLSWVILANKLRISFTPWAYNFGPLLLKLEWHYGLQYINIIIHSFVRLNMPPCSWVLVWVANWHSCIILSQSLNDWINFSPSFFLYRPPVVSARVLEGQKRLSIWLCSISKVLVG